MAYTIIGFLFSLYQVNSLSAKKTADKKSVSSGAIQAPPSHFQNPTSAFCVLSPYHCLWFTVHAMRYALHALRLVLLRHQRSIILAGLQEGFVNTHIHQTTLVQKQYAIGIFYGGRPIRHQEQGLVLYQVRE